MTRSEALEPSGQDVEPEAARRVRIERERIALGDGGGHGNGPSGAARPRRAARIESAAQLGRMPPQVPPRDELEEANLSVLVTEAAGDMGIVYANPAFERLTGYDRDELIGRNCRLLQGPGTDPAAVDRLREALAERSEVREVLLNYRKDGTPFWNDLFIAPVRDAAGAVVQFVGVQRDASDRRRLVDELRRSEELHRRIIEAAGDGICLVDVAGRITFANPRLAAMLNLPLESLVGTLYPSFLPAGERDLAASHYQRSERGAVERHDVALRRPDGSELWVSVASTSVREPDGSFGSMLLMLSDITERKRGEQRLRFLADHDALTGLASRRRLYERLEQTRAHHLRRGGTSALAVLDVDQFKLINDSRGHRAGDMVLREVANILSAERRVEDTAARMGGDEFALLLDGANASAAERAVARIAAAVGRIEADWPLTVSAGIVVLEAEAAGQVDDVVRAADVALYEAKDRGRAQVVVYSRASPSDLGWVDSVRRLLVEDRLVLYCQPIIDTETGNHVHDEVLLRVLDDQGQPQSPGPYLRAAERFDLIGAIDSWVIARAIDMAADGRRVSVNVSARSLGKTAITDAIEQHLTRTGADPANLMFEITETAAIADLRGATAFAGRLAALGCTLALDDFGTGFGAFNHLRHLPVHYLKIDMEFVSSIADSAIDQRIVRAIVSIAQTLGQLTIAEGVEDLTTIRLLRELGVTEAQGYAIGRPAPCHSVSSSD